MDINTAICQTLYQAVCNLHRQLATLQLKGAIFEIKPFGCECGANFLNITYNSTHTAPTSSFSEVLVSCASSAQYMSVHFHTTLHCMFLHLYCYTEQGQTPTRFTFETDLFCKQNAKLAIILIFALFFLFAVNLCKLDSSCSQIQKHLLYLQRLVLT